MSLDAIKRRFRDGRQAEAIAELEALATREPGRADARRTLAMMHVMTRSFARALELLQALRDPRKPDADLLFNIGMCEKELGRFTEAATTFGAYTESFAGDAGGWASLAECQFELQAFEEGMASARRAIALDPSLASELARRQAARGDAAQGAQGAVHDRAALALDPRDDATLKKATVRLLEIGRGQDAIALCREVLRADPGNLTARLGAEWVLSQQVPLWHVPMMNEQERNQAFHDGLRAAVVPGQLVFEIGAGSGLLAMMAARLGAEKVVTCEAVPLVAETAAKIVARNGLQDRVTVLSKPSTEVRVGADLPAKADLLVHEIFSSELIGEFVLPAIEDAKARLLKPGGRILPSAASIMVALVGGEDLGKHLHVDQSFGFDLREFNAIHPRKRPLYREDLSPLLLSQPVEAFRFDFQGRSSYPAERKRLQLAATQAGACYGVIQWIRIELGEGVVFENHPARQRRVSNWQHTVYGFGDPVQLQPGQVLAVDAWHDRTRPWFDLASS
ncbi:50S ribosomal protein L11 methyltransferase [Ramlibacter sp. XY19]|uniref:tetratricopeptide repeat protein n=1 Tax=Ramlibacter paludis TaxID=2908000 RepID=UPI0023DA85E8|nr:50S ribosomal protein L11 methyltransferase [Ramlibacter paludis]MCG2594388.1 50S ribosomal protein L11 methyltransferase [Ramlibacter paludis]